MAAPTIPYVFLGVVQWLDGIGTSDGPSNGESVLGTCLSRMRRPAAVVIDTVVMPENILCLFRISASSHVLILARHTAELQRRSVV